MTWHNYEPWNLGGGWRAASEWFENDRPVPDGIFPDTVVVSNKLPTREEAIAEMTRFKAQHDRS